MQIKHIACSNIYHFDFKSKLEIPHHGINFDIDPSTSDIHIVIGSSGSGKSHFFRIIDQVWGSIWYHPVSCSLDMRAGEAKNILHYHQPVCELTSYHHTELKAKLMLQIHLGNVDLVRLHRLHTHLGEVNHIIRQYSDCDVVLQDYSDDIDASQYLTFVYEIDYTDQSVCLLTSDPYIVFVEQYLRYYNLIRYCIVIHNRLHSQDMWYHREPLFGHISHMRDQDILALMRHDKQRSNISDALTHALQVCKTVVGWGSDHMTYYQELYQDMIYYIDTYLDLKLQCSIVQDDLHLSFINKQKQSFTFAQLSSSDQACIVMILGLVGSMVRFGLVLIEEPELHLHPQYQLLMGQLLEALSQKYHNQVLLHTNSSLLINEHNIDNVFRLCMKDQTVHMINPRIVEKGNEAKLSQILTFTNSAKLFFVDTVILVEGETDEYFFKKYFDDMHLQYGHRKLLHTFQIINIRGKGSLQMWIDFLQKFQLRYRFIGDWDNIIETGIEIDREKYSRHIRHRPPLTKSQTYDEIISQIQTKSPDLRDHICASIQASRQKHILILSQGDFESYLGLEDKGLAQTIDFMQHRYHKRLKEYRFAPARKEFEEIYHLIFDQDL